MAPQGAECEAAIGWWRSLASDAAAQFDQTITIAAETIAPQVSWGTNPSQSLPISDRVPDPDSAKSPAERAQIIRALDYMGLKAGEELSGIAIDTVFIGSCTNGRIEDLREAARVLAGRQVAKDVTVLIVPGSVAVRRQAESEGLDHVFRAAGAQWREPGCSMCVAINDDRLAPRQRCAATSNRNFEGRQGQEGRTHLMSPAMAAAAAVTGHLTDVRELGVLA
jgi:3-isopropylmalate/(R)-2-methylmalate dehydratase large subunit